MTEVHRTASVISISFFPCSSDEYQCNRPEYTPV